MKDVLKGLGATVFVIGFVLGGLYLVTTKAWIADPIPGEVWEDTYCQLPNPFRPRSPGLVRVIAVRQGWVQVENVMQVGPLLVPTSVLFETAVSNFKWGYTRRTQ